MTSGGQIRFGVGFNVDKAGLNELKNSLTAISKMTTEQYLDINKGLNINEAQQELNKVKTTVQSVQNALSKSFNADLDSTNLTKFNSELAKSGTSLKQVYSDLSKTGSAGQQAFRKIATQLTTQNTHLKESHRLLNEMATTMANTVKWSVASSAINTLTGSIQKAYSYVRDLDTSLNDIRIVTDKSAESMQKFAKQANDAAKALGKSTTDYTEASLIYYQQGLSEEDVAARAEVTLKAANVTAQSTDEVSEQLTAVWNGYKVSAEEAELYVDKLAAVAASTAADLEELSTGMSKVASAANSMGVDIDELNAQLATIVSVTRQAPESVGTALKTIYARLGDLAVDGEDEFGVALGTVSKTMEKMGIQILDEQGQMREMGDVITETAEKWETWTDAQKQAAAVAMAGKRQYNNLIALFDNWDMYEEALSTSADAAGTLQNQQDIYMESTEAHLKALKASAEDVYDSIFNAESFNTLLDGLTTVVNLIGDFIDGIGGAGNLILLLGGTMTRVFNKQIAGSIMTTVNNFQKMNENAENVKALKDIYEELDKIIEENGNSIDETTKKITAMGKSINALEGKIDPETLNGLKEYTKALEENAKEQEDFQKRKQKALEDLSKMSIVEAADTDEYWDDMRQEGGDARSNKESGKDKSENYKKLSTQIKKNIDEFKAAKKVSEDFLKTQKKLKAAREDAFFDAGKILTEDELNQVEEYKKVVDELTQSFSAFSEKSAGYAAIAEHQLLSEETKNNLVELAEAYEAAKNRYGEGSIQATNAAAAMVEAYQNAAEEIIKAHENIAETAEEVVNGIEDNLDEARDSIESGFQNALKRAVTEENIQNVTDYIGAMTQMVASIKAITGLGNIWSDETLTSSEKMSQTITALAAAVPGLVGSIKQVKDVIKPMANAFNIGTKTMGAWLIGITAAIAAVTTIISLIEAKKEALLESAKATLEEKNAEIEEYKANRELAQSYEETLKKYKEGAATREELNASIDAVCTAYELEGAAVYKLREDYEGLNQAIRDKRKLNLAGTYGAISDAEEAKEAAGEQMLISAEDTSAGSVGINNSYNLKLFRGADDKDEKDAHEILLRNVTGASEMQAQRGRNSPSYRTTGIQIKKDFNNYEDIVELYDELFTSRKEMQEKMTFTERKASEYYKYTDEWLNVMKETVEAYKAASTELSSLNLEKDFLEIDVDNIDSYEKYNEVRNDLLENAKERKALNLGINVEELDEETIKTLTSQVDTLLSSYAEFEEMSAQRQNISAFEEMFDTSDLGMSKSEIETWMQENIYDTENGVAIAAFLDLKGTETEGQLDAAWEKAQVIYETKQRDNRLSLLGDAITTIEGGEELSDIDIQKLQEEYLELADIQKLGAADQLKLLAQIKNTEISYINETQEKQVEANQKLIEEKRRQLEEVKRSGPKEANGAAEAKANLEEYSELILKLESDIEDLVSQDFELKFSIEEDIVKQVDEIADNIISYSEKMREGAELIGEGYKVAKEDVAEFAAIYPELLRNSEVFTDGSIQLNKDLVTATLKGDAAIVESDKQKAIDILDNQITILESDYEKVEEQLKLAKGLAHGAISLDTAKIYAYENNMTGFSEFMGGQYQAWLADSNAVNGTMASNTANLADSQVQDINRIADAWVAVYQAQSEGSYDPSNFRTGAEASYEGIAEYTPTDSPEGMSEEEAAAEAAKRKAELEKAYGAALVGALEKNKEAIANQIASLTNTKSKLLGSTFDTEAALKGAYSGLGGKTTDDAKEDNQDFADSLEEIYDRYYDINIQLDLLETNLSRVQKQQEKLTGKGYIQNLQQQLDILNKQIEANKTKLSITEQEMAEVMAALQLQGASFNEEGQVTNYKAVIDAALAEANAVIATYNSMSGEQQEAYKATMESAKESYDALVSTFERFDDLYTEEIPGLIDTIQEALDQAVELKIEQFNTEIQITLDMRQAEREWNDFYANVLNNLKDDDLVGQVKLGATQFGTYYGDGGSTVATDIAKLEALNEQAAQMLNGKFATTYGDNYAKLYEDLIAANEQLMTDMEAAQGIADGIYDNYLSSIDKVIEGNDAVIEQYEYINGLLDHNVKLIELMGADEKSSMLTDQYAQRNALNQQMIKDHYANTQYYEQMMNSIDDKTSEEWQKWSEAWQSEVTALNNSIITAMEDAAAAYANAIDIAMQEMESAFTDGMGFSYIQDEWDLVNENAEMYLDTINSAYEISSLENKFAEAINSTESLSAQKKLRAAMEEELKILEEADQVSQYDIDRANLKYELTLKQIALEEAQNNKSTMKLRRDSQGNMSYVFAADQDEVSKAQQELAEAENELYNFDKDAYKEKTSAILKAEQDLQSKLKDIWNDESLTQKQKEEYAAMVSEQYRKIIDANISESEKTKQNLSDDTLSILMKNYQEELDKAIETANGEEEATRIAVEEMQKKFKGLVDESNPDSFINAMNELSQNWGDGTFAPGTFTGNLSSSTQSLVDNIQSSFRTGLSTISSGFAGEGGEYPSLVEVISGAMGKCKTAAEEFGNTVGNIATAAGITTLKDQTDGLNGSTDTLKATMLLLLQANTDYIVKVTGKEGTLEAAKNLAEQYRQQHIEITNVNTSMTNYLKKLEDMKAKAEAAAKAARDLSTALKTQTSAQKNTGGGSSGVGQASSTNTATVNSGGGSSAPTTTQNVDNRSQEEKDGGKYGTWTAHYDAKGAKDNTYPPQTYTGWAYQVGSASGTYPVGIAKRKGGTRFGWVSGFDTGGYTGEWGDDGKLAVLHEKEIVLNKTDTSNLLDIVSMVREMTSNSLQGANGMLSGMIEALASVTNNSNSTSQTIHITAEFPGVKVASEIEEAFNNLANIASQHAFQY